MTKSSSIHKNKAMILKELGSFLGEENVSDNPAVRSGYRGSNYNYLFPWGKAPELVVMPKSVEHVQEVVKLANKEKLTILPICCGTVTPFCEADIIIDMMGMDKIIKIDTDNSYVVLEPGVTFNRLTPFLIKEGYTIPHGSFPPSFSVIGNLGARRGFNHNFAGRFADQTLGFEIVLPDGTLLKTGTATYGMDYWSPLTMDMPDIRGLFFASGQRTPPLGIITKAALRIWPIMEVRGLPIGGFDSFGKALRFCKALSKAGIADESMVWSWVLVGMCEARAQGGKMDMDFLTHRMTNDYTRPYKGLHYCYTWTQFRGYKEQVDVNLKLCERIAKEMGGKILSDEELQNTIPKLWETWKFSYKDFQPEKTKAFHLWKVGGDGMIEAWYYAGWIDDLIKLEEAFNRRIREKYHRLPQPYYCRIFESGVGGHLRYQPAGDMADEYQAKKYIAMRQEMHDWVINNFPNIHAPGGYKRPRTHSIGLGNVLDKIRDAIDPNHIGYLPGEKRLESEDEGLHTTSFPPIASVPSRK
jgi:FAD/FMN-containing dehydrogenase